VNVSQQGTQPLFFLPSSCWLDQAFAQILNDMPFPTCRLVFFTPCQAPFASIPLILSYMRTPWHTWLVPKSWLLGMDLYSLGPSFEVKFESNLESSRTQLLESIHMAISKISPRLIWAPFNINSQSCFKDLNQDDLGCLEANPLWQPWSCKGDSS
jgi:hypothetical protein